MSSADACGNWAAHNQIPSGENGLKVLDAMGDDIYHTARQILDTPYPSRSEAGWITVDLTDEQVDADMENLAKTQGAYQTCMNQTARAEEGLTPLLSFVQKIVDAFPVSQTTNKDGEAPGTGDYSDAIGKTVTLLESFGIESTQRMLVRQNNHDPNETHLIIMPGSSDMPATEEAIGEYVNLAATLISEVHPGNLTVDKAAALMGSVVELEVNLGQAMLVAASEEVNETSENPLMQLSPRTSLAEIQKSAPQLNYEYVVSQLAPEGYAAERVALPYASYYKNLSDTISATPAEVLQTFFVWKTLSALSPYIESEATNAYIDFRNEQAGRDLESPSPRWETCVAFLDEGVEWITSHNFANNMIGPSGLTWILARFFAEKRYSPKAKDLTTEMVKSLKEGFLERLEAKDWVSDEVKAAAAEKVHAMIEMVALPTDPDVLDPIAARSYYADAEISSSHFGNALTLANTSVGRRWASLGVPFEGGQFKVSTLVPSAYQDWQRNAIVLQAGIQQSPLFDVDFPSYILFGGMGSAVGHELTHGFDVNGRHYDATGNMTDWWDDETVEAFTERAACFVEQYGGFTVTAANGTEVPVDGARTLGENIADAGGVASSFAAWRKWEEEKAPSQDLPGLDGFTHEQLFFLRWGQTFCKNMPAEESVREVLDTEETHSPADARILLTLANSADFKEAYNCPKRDPVCELW